MPFLLGAPYVLRLMLDEQLRADFELQSNPGVHTCHADCPCQHGGAPMPDFVHGPE